MRIIATLFGKLVLLCLTVLGRKGTALPGLLIEKLYPNYLNVMLDELPRGVIIVTGTNGKTTTTKVITELMRAQGLRVLTNPTGSNFVRGIIAAIAKHATFSGRLNHDIAVFEQDEAHAVRFAQRYQPVGVVALNVMRDQMDRFGEIDTTAKLIGKLVKRAKSWVVLNANDKRIAALAHDARNRRITWFGHGKSLQQLFIDDDQLYSQNPVFYEAARPDVELTEVSNGKLDLRVQRDRHTVPTTLDGTHNAINVAAALAAIVAATPEADMDTMVGAVAAIKPAFGRGELVRLPNGVELRLQLVKNPAGFRHALQQVKTTEYTAVGIAINDDYADGRDVSWLWDVDFSILQGRAAAILTGGTRAADMANRLKYDEVKVNHVEPDLLKFLRLITEPTNNPAIVFCTYTAMLRLRKLLKRDNKSLRSEGL